MTLQRAELFGEINNIDSGVKSIFKPDYKIIGIYSKLFLLFTFYVWYNTKRTFLKGGFDSEG